MSQTVQYLQYTITSCPLPPLNGGRWTVGIAIAWEENGAVIRRQFSAETTCPSESEADVHGITFGHRIIDGKVPGLSVK
jgi:hypothetical protein